MPSVWAAGALHLTAHSYMPWYSLELIMELTVANVADVPRDLPAHAALPGAGHPGHRPQPPPLLLRGPVVGGMKQ